MEIISGGFHATVVLSIVCQEALIESFAAQFPRLPMAAGDSCQDTGER